MSTDPRIRWRKQALSDRRLSHGAFRLAFALAEHFNIETLKCWPSQQTLADAAGGIDVRTVRRLTDELVQAGYVEIEENEGGRGRSKTYIYVMVEKRTSAPLFGDGKADISAPFRGRKKRTSMAPKSGHPLSEKRTSMAEKGALVSDKPLKEPLHEPHQLTSSRAQARASHAGLKTMEEILEEDRRRNQEDRSLEARRQKIEPAMSRLRVAYSKQAVAEEEWLEARNLVEYLVEHHEADPDRFVQVAISLNPSKYKFTELPEPVRLLDPDGRFRMQRNKIRLNGAAVSNALN